MVASASQEATRLLEVARNTRGQYESFKAYVAWGIAYGAAVGLKQAAREMGVEWLEVEAAFHAPAAAKPKDTADAAPACPSCGKEDCARLSGPARCTCCGAHLPHAAVASWRGRVWRQSVWAVGQLAEGLKVAGKEG
jgi:hypothetical protein